MLLYTDDTLAIGDYPEKLLRKGICKYFQLKKGSIGPPKIYLGGSVSKVKIDNTVEAWAFSSLQNIQAAVKNVEDYLVERNDPRWTILFKAETLMRASY
eukprot:14174145-Ditylum_brightwellii.AAC.1